MDLYIAMENIAIAIGRSDENIVQYADECTRWSVDCHHPTLHVNEVGYSVCLRIVQPVQVELMTHRYFLWFVYVGSLKDFDRELVVRHFTHTHGCFDYARGRDQRGQQMILDAPFECGKEFDYVVLVICLRSFKNKSKLTSVH